MKLKDFLELRGAITDISALAKVKAQYSVTFELARPETSMNNIRLDVNFEESPGAIESGSVTYNWFRTTPRSIQQPPMQLSMIDFDRYPCFPAHSN